MQIKIVYYGDVISSWCYWAEPAWTKLQERYADRADFEWRVALLDPTGLPQSSAQEDWFYRRSGVTVRSPFMLNSGWMEVNIKEYLAPNALAEAARDLGVAGDHVRRSLAEAAVREGQKVGRWEVSTAIAARSSGLDPETLLTRARSQTIESRVRATTAEFHALGVTQRPAFVIDDEIGDRAVFSGLITFEPLDAAIQAMLNDCTAYQSWKAHFGGPPSE